MIKKWITSDRGRTLGHAKMKHQKSPAWTPFYPTTDGGVTPRNWYEADFGISGSPISQWNDKTGTDHLTQATGIKQPLLVPNVLNGHPIVRFDGINDCIYKAPIASNLTQPFTIFAVMKDLEVGEAPNDAYYFGGDLTFDITNRLHVLRYYSSSPDRMRMWAGATLLTFNIDNSWHVFTFIFNTATSSTLRDGIVYGPSGNVSTKHSTALLIGASGNAGGAAAQMDLAAMLIYPGVSSGPDQLQIGGYLNSKYGF
jgi:hypothetical protein